MGIVAHRRYDICIGLSLSVSRGCCLYSLSTGDKRVRLLDTALTYHMRKKMQLQ